MCAEDNFVPLIEDSVTLNANFPTVGERYFTHYYYVPKKQLLKTDASTLVSVTPETKLLQQQHDVQQLDHKPPSEGEESTPMVDCTSTPLPSVTEKKVHSDDGLPCTKKLRLDDGSGRSISGCNQQQSETSINSQKCMVNNELVERMHLGAVISAGNLSHSERSNMAVDSESTEIEAKESFVGYGKGDSDDKEYNLTGTETLVMVHSNKLCVVSLSPFHPIVRENKTVTKVEYEVFGIDRLSNKVSGKGKRGAQVMGSKATLCRMHVADGTTYDVTCGARGKLVQVNEKLLQKPDMARSRWGAEGWLGVVLPSLQHFDGLMAALMPSDCYEKAYRRQFEEHGPLSED